MKKNISLTLLLLLLSTSLTKAQVTIGNEVAPRKGVILDLKNANGAAGYTGGLLFPHVNILDLGYIPPTYTDYANIVDEGTTDAVKGKDTKAELAGMMVYNTNVDTGVGIYLWDGDDWMKLNLGGSVVLKPDLPACDPYPADGDCSGGYTVTDPSCKDAGTYSFTWIAGEEFIESLVVDDAGAAHFTVTFLPNNRASSRNAILLVTSPCGNSNTFVFTQDGDASLCTPLAIAPTIASENSDGTTISLCSGGAVYLYLTNGVGGPRLTGANGTYIWTLNGQVVASDTVSYITTQAGKYIVYANAIGCTNYKPDTLVIAPPTGTGAPDPVAIIIGVNSGNVCATSGPNSTTKLYVKTPATGTLVWYKDGVKQTAPTVGSDPVYSWVEAGIGNWFAVVESGTGYCSSTPSNTVKVKLADDAGTALPAPAFTVNGQSGTVSV